MKTKLFIFIGLLGIALIASSFTFFCTSCNSANSMVPPPDYNIYEQEWEKVDSLVNIGLPKSALELVEKIYSKAKNENNSPQFIKATLYKIKLKAYFE